MATLNSTKINGSLSLTYGTSGLYMIQFGIRVGIPIMLMNTLSNLKSGIDGFRMSLSDNDTFWLGTALDKSMKITRSGDVTINSKLSVTANNNVPLEIFSGEGNDNYADGIRLHPYDSDSDTSIIFCGSDNTGSSGMSSKSWCIYNHDGEFHIRDNTSDAILINGGNSIDLYRSVTFANNRWNKVGDDVYVGNHNISGGFCLKGANADTKLAFFTPDESQYKSITYDGNMLHLEGYADSAEYPSIYGGNIAHSHWAGAFPNSSNGYTLMFGYALSHGSVNSAQDTGDILFALKPVGSAMAELNIGIDGNYWQRGGQPVVSVASYSNGVLSLQAGY